MRCARRRIPSLCSPLYLAAALAALLAAVFFWSPSARADQGKAAELYKKGMAAYALEDWDGAIAEWDRGFREEPKPEFLYNIAQAHRQAGRHEQAMRFYQRYLDLKPDAADRAEVERLIRVLRVAISEKQRATAAPPVGFEPKPETPAAPEPAEAKDVKPASGAVEKKTDWVMVGLLAAGGVVALTGAGVAISGAMARSEAEDPLATLDLGERESQYASGGTRALAGYCLVGAGAALLAGGLIKMALKPKADVAASVMITPGAVAASIGGRF